MQIENYRTENIAAQCLRKDLLLKIGKFPNSTFRNYLKSSEKSFKNDEMRLRSYQLKKLVIYLENIHI